MKLELNVVRMANEDVIATSSASCSYIGSSEFDGGSFMANHIKTHGTTFDAYVDSNQNGILENTVSGKDLLLFAMNYNGKFDGVYGAGWYHWDGTKFVECDGDCEHPTENN